MNLLVTTLLLTLHLIAVNLAVGGPVVCIWLQHLGKNNERALELGRRLAWNSVWALATGMVLGALILAFFRLVGETAYWDMLKRLPKSAYWSAAGELAFSLSMMVIYAWIFRVGRGRPLFFSLLPLLSTTNLLYHFPPLMSAMSQIADRPLLIEEETIARSIMLEVMRRPESMALTTHFGLASFAVSGIALMLIAGRENHRFIAWGAGIALIATLGQLLVGVWLLIQIAPQTRGALIGSDALATLLFAASLLGVFGLLHVLVAAALGDTVPGRARNAALLLFAVILLMTAAMTRAREAAPLRFVPLAMKPDRTLLLKNVATTYQSSVAAME